MSYESVEIANFESEFSKFSYHWNYWNNNKLPSFNTLAQFNTKLRMPFAIKKMSLEQEFLVPKESEIEDLHLFFYKLVDLWFAYETFFKFYKKLNNNKPSIDRITWIEMSEYEQYLSEIITKALNSANEKINQGFSLPNSANSLKEYILRCKKYATGKQGQRLGNISENLNQDSLSLTIKDILTITYAIRNNFVHNGETTITNAGLEDLDFNELQKLKLVKICYNFLAIFVVNIANTLIEQHTHH